MRTATTSNNAAKWTGPSILFALSLVPLLISGYRYFQIPEAEEVHNTQAALTQVRYGATRTTFLWQIGGEAFEKTISGKLQGDMETYAGSYNIGDTFTIALVSSSTDDLLGLKLRGHCFFTYQDYRKSMLEGIQTGPLLIGFSLLFAAFVSFLLVGVYPRLVQRAERKMKRKLLAQSGMVDEGGNRYRVTVKGYSVSMEYILPPALRNQHAFFRVLIKVPTEVSTRYYLRLVGRFDTHKEGTQYYILLEHRTDFMFSIKKLMKKVHQQVEALDNIAQ